ncbi:hypothetical protein [Amycolatopsis sp. CA-230715]|uniref:hypothetical protein n=1 Tax=Amycolatopsis sp. CA-230715 TaxID=2745196 RepID=UPI001C021C05|nr:hypothetical protein [Amycolatopsis sp. CA-230715]QWF81243.1 hypothetical protein HUW46_04673 [Amycolatopsis sp. CA-230715]
MPDEDLKELLGATGAAEGPPMGFSAEEIIGRGGRIRRRRKGFAVAATSVATAGAIAAVALLVPSRAPAPVQPAGPNVATPSVTAPPPKIEPAPTSVPTAPMPKVAPSQTERQRSSPTPERRSPSRTSTPSAEQPPAPPAATLPSTGMPPPSRPSPTGR